MRRRIGGHGLDNLVLLCGTCHRFVHAHPATARAEGYILSSFNSEPAAIPVAAFHGLVLLTTSGTYENGDPDADQG